MFSSQREKYADPDIVALVEFDMQKMRVRIALAREAISERLRELEHPRDRHQEGQGFAPTATRKSPSQVVDP